MAFNWVESIHCGEHDDLDIMSPIPVLKLMLSASYSW